MLIGCYEQMQSTNLDALEPNLTLEKYGQRAIRPSNSTTHNGIEPIAH